MILIIVLIIIIFIILVYYTNIFSRILRIFFWCKDIFSRRKIDRSNYITIPSHLLKIDNILSDSSIHEIPKIIFQTSEDKNIPPRMFDAINSWLKMNPDYNYYFFDKDARRDFLMKEFDESVVKAYDSIKPGTYKADLWKYCVVYIYGGVYADAKMVCKVSLDELIDSPFVSVRDRPDASILSAFFCAIPKYPFLKRAIKITVSNILNRRYGENILDITGPRVLGRAINDILGLPQDHKFSIGKQNINSYQFTLFDHPHKTKITKNNKEIIQKKYDDNTSKKDSWEKMTGLDSYTRAWHTRNVYN